MPAHEVWAEVGGGSGTQGTDASPGPPPAPTPPPTPVMAPMLAPMMIGAEQLQQLGDRKKWEN